VGLSTVRDFEKGERTPIPNNLAAIRRAVESAGIRLVFASSRVGQAIPVPTRWASWRDENGNATGLSAGRDPISGFGSGADE
jgi:hypothetical protein